MAQFSKDCASARDVKLAYRLAARYTHLANLLTFFFNSSYLPHTSTSMSVRCSKSSSLANDVGIEAG